MLQVPKSLAKPQKNEVLVIFLLISFFQKSIMRAFFDREMRRLSYVVGTQRKDSADKKKTSGGSDQVISVS